MMIISLYDSSYPVYRDTEPKWQSLPVAYFRFHPNQMSKFDASERIRLQGQLIYADTANSFRPTLSDAYLAVFGFKHENYITRASLAYASKLDNSQNRKTVWFAHIVLFDLIKKWN